jgi:hypothetical protein
MRTLTAPADTSRSPRDPVALGVAALAALIASGLILWAANSMVIAAHRISPLAIGAGHRRPALRRHARKHRPDHRLDHRARAGERRGRGACRHRSRRPAGLRQ